ncbi:PEP/pyruvate-binding domain-containing protein [Streptomyces caeni]|uniref:PEP/pyruvate-binding domain-containing protein n=1 Tax=Streptomyces caeni TaxID=2307231 RepID=A0ABW4INR1_9ACTN
MAGRPARVQRRAGASWRGPPVSPHPRADRRPPPRSRQTSGRQQTFLGVTGEEASLDACRRCHASLFTDRAISHRLHHGSENLEPAWTVRGTVRPVRDGCLGIPLLSVPHSLRTQRVLASCSRENRTARSVALRSRLGRREGVDGMNGGYCTKRHIVCGVGV